MNRKILFLAILCAVIWITTPTAGEPSTCLAVNKESGDPAVIQSPGVPILDRRCQSATRQGRRTYMEDRTFCTLDIRIPFPDGNGIRDTPVGIVTVFDGHNGAEASEMASKLLLKYFTKRTYSLLDNAFSSLPNTSMGMLPDKGEHDYDCTSQMVTLNESPLSTIFDKSFNLEILKESLLKAIDDIDTTFSNEASRNNFTSGSTATVVLIADGQILAANIGDSKAFLCSETFQSPSEAKSTIMRLYTKKKQDGVSVRMKDYGNFKNGLTFLSVKELTKDHHPDRADERFRVESSGGHVIEWAGVSRVNGQLAVSRSIGDVSFKRYGVISIPEVTDWQPVTVNDSYLVVASDGVFERQDPQDVCDLLWESRANATVDLKNILLADLIVDSALERGSKDNVAAVVVPFGLETLLRGQSGNVRLESYVDEHF